MLNSVELKPLLSLLHLNEANKQELVELYRFFDKLKVTNEYQPNVYIKFILKISLFNSMSIFIYKSLLIVVICYSTSGKTYFVCELYSDKKDESIVSGLLYIQYFLLLHAASILFWNWLIDIFPLYSELTPLLHT